jgi:hypothetical protein
MEQCNRMDAGGSCLDRIVRLTEGGSTVRRGSSFKPRPRIVAIAALGIVALTVGALGVLPALSARGAKDAPANVASTTFRLFPNTTVRACAQAKGKTAKATARVVRGALNDTLTLTLSGFKPGLDFDLFTVQNSNQNANGSPVSGFTNFGLAWYQSDVHVGSNGKGSVTIKTILLDQIFGFDPAVSLAPTNTFHVGFWFNDPAKAAPCGFTGVTPFNGEHNAGPLAFITRPDAKDNLGPLCTDKVSPGVCNP